MNKGVMTAEDLLKGKVICYRCITMATLFIVIVGTAIHLFSQASIAAGNLSLLIWLTVVLGACLYFAMANKDAKLKDSKIEVANGKILVYENGELKKAEAIDQVSVEYTSWNYNNKELRPAVILHGDIIGTVRIATSTEQFDWIHINTMVRDTHYMVESRYEWAELLNTLRSRYLFNTTYNPLT